MIVIGKEVSDWVADRIGNTTWHDEQAIGIEKDGVIVGGVVVDSYVPNARCSIHCAGEGKRWINREFIFVVFDYVFRQLGCQVVINTVDASNTDSLRFTEHIGFTKALEIKNGCGDNDLILFTMQKEDCRWKERK